MWQLHNYLYGDDLTTVLYKTFHQDEIDVYPNIGFCFSNSLIEEKLNNYQITVPNKSKRNVSSLKHLYSDFLSGNYWDQDMLRIDYDDVTKNIDDYLMRYVVDYRLRGEPITIYDATDGSIHNSQTEETEMLRTKQKRRMIPHVSELSLWSYKCVSIDIPFLKNRMCSSAFVDFKPGIFSDGIRPSGVQFNLRNDEFRFVPHYPKQLIRSLLQGESRWPVQQKNRYEAYYSSFNMRGVEILQHRNKFNKPCNKGIPDNDEQMIQFVTNKIGCKPPFWNSTSEMPLCLTKEELQKTTELIFQIFNSDGNLNSLNYTRPKNYTQPCRVLQKYQFDFTDIDVKEDELGKAIVRLEISFK